MTRTVLLISLLVGSIASAEESALDNNQSKMAAPAEVSQAKRKDVDKEITNPKMRAETGSKAVLSLQSDFTYNGGSVSEPFGAQRPRLSPGQVELDPVKITGNVSAKYRVTDNDNLNFGTGVGWLTPGNDGQRGQMENPFLQYGRPFRIGDFQNVVNLRGTYYTAANSRNNFKLNYGVSLSHTILTTIGKTKWTVGAASVYAQDVYSRRSLNANESVAFYPFTEYWFTERFHFRSVYRGLTFFNTNMRRDLFERDEPTQSLGFGFVVTRDIYVYPNIQWVWNDMKGEKTNVAMTANINL